MSRLAPLALAVVLVLAGLVFSSVGRGAAAPGEAEVPSCVPAVERPDGESSRGVVTDVLGRGDPAAIAPFSVRLNRSTFAPEGMVRQACYLGIYVVYVDEGALDLTIVDGVARRTAEPLGANDDSLANECVADCDLALPSTVTLRSGESIYLENATYSILNPGDLDAVAYVSITFQEDLPCPSGCWEWP